MPTTFSIHGYVLDAMLNFTADPRGFATTSVLTDVLAEMTDDSLRFIATNTQVMGILHITAMNAYGLDLHCQAPHRLVIPVNDLKPMIQDKRYPQIQLTVDGLEITVKNAAGISATVLGRAPEEYPDYHTLIPTSQAQPLSGLAVDGALLGRFLAFAKALKQEASLTLGFHGAMHPCSVLLKNISAFYGMLMPSPLAQPVSIPSWLTLQHGLDLTPPPLVEERMTVRAVNPINFTATTPPTLNIPSPQIAVFQPPLTTYSAVPADIVVGQMVTYQGHQYPFRRVDGEWIELDTSTAGKKSWCTVRKSCLDAPVTDNTTAHAPTETEAVTNAPISTATLPSPGAIIVKSHPAKEETPVPQEEIVPVQTIPSSLEVDTVTLAKAIYTRLQHGDDFATKRELHKYLAGVLGIDPAAFIEAISRLAIDPRALDEAYEYAQVLRARDLAHNSALSHEEKLQRFLKHYQQQLSVSQRDTTVTQHQQYSTPLPLCYLIGRYLNLEMPGRYYEPTAGNGSLVITADPAQVIVNELDAGPRLSALKDQAFGQVFNDDALQLPTDHPELFHQLDAVVMNPPFHALETPTQYQGYKITKLEHLIALRSLELMTDGGRAAVIIGGHSFFDRFGGKRDTLQACDAVFFNYLYAHYHVVANIDVNGDLYQKQGTTFPVRVLLIEGRNLQPIEGYAAPRDPSQVQRAETWQELDYLLTPPERNETGTASHGATVPLLVHEEDDASLLIESIERVLSGHANEYQAIYEPVSRHPGRVEYLSPKNLTEPQRTALEQIQGQHGSIDTYLQQALGYETLADLYEAFHAAQIDGIALAISNLAQGRGMIIGDGTGVGKGREAAAVIAWAHRQGKFPIFFTQNPKLFSDIYSDLRDIGKPLTPFIMNSGKEAHIVDTSGEILVRAEGSRAKYQQIITQGVDAPVLRGCDFLVVNYPQINTENAQRQALSRLADGNVIILDESHNASGDSGTGQFVRDQLLQTASSVLYLSATYAKRPNTMPLYYRTDLGNAGLSLPQLIEAIEHGGVALQQVIAADLAKAGQYIRREMDFSQVEYYQVTIDYAHEARDIERSDGVTEILRDIVQYDLIKAELVGQMHQKAREQGKALGKIDGTNRTAAGVSSTTFTATVHNIISQMLLAIKADTVVERAISVSRHPDPAQRKKVVIGLMNTLESHLKALIDAGDLYVGQQVDHYTFKEVLKKALRNTLRYRVKDHTGNSTGYQFSVPGVYLPDAKIGMPLDPVSEALFFDLLAKIERMHISLPGSPIDYMIHQMRAAGLRVGELTGRTYLFNADGTLTARTGSDKNKNKLVNAFNSGELDVLIINSAGATGLSIHSSPKFKDQTPRLMLVPQSQLNIDTELQLYGRINRTGQVNGPAFEIMQTALPSEIRPAAILQGKMASINANISANDGSHYSLKDIPDMMNKYGDEIVETYLRENPEIYQMIGEPERGESLEHGGYFRKVSGRIALASVTVQRAFYEVVEQRYRRTIAYLDQMGTNDLVTKDYDFQAKTIFRLKTQEGTDESNPFKSSVYVEEVSAKVLAKPYPRARVERDVKAYKRPSEKVVMEALRRGQEYLASFQRKLPGLEADKQAGTANRIREIEENVRTVEAFSLEHQQGSTYALSLGDGNGEKTIAGVFVSITHDYDPKKDFAKNPVMPSSFGTVFYVPDSRQEVTIPLSQRQERIGVLVQEGIPNDWDEVIPAGDRETRYITTGNIMQAMGGDNGFSGSNLVRYTTEHGESKYGILWPEGTKREEIIRRYASYHGSAASAVAYLDSDKVVFAKTDKKNGRVAVLYTSGPAQVVYYPDKQCVELHVQAGMEKATCDAIIYAPRIQSLLRQRKFVVKQTGWLGVADSQDVSLLLHAMENVTTIKFILPRESVLDEIAADIARVQHADAPALGQCPASTSSGSHPSQPVIPVYPHREVQLFQQPDGHPFAPAVVHETPHAPNY